MIWNAVEFINALAEMGIICIYFNKLMKSKPTYLWQKILGYLLAAVVMAFCSVTFEMPVLLLMVTFVLLIFLTLVFYDEKIINKIFYSFMYIVVILIVDPVFVGISYVSNIFTYESLFQNGIGRIIGMLISKVLYLWISAALARILTKMLMYGKEASNRKQEVDRQHHTIPKQKPNDRIVESLFPCIF